MHIDKAVLTQHFDENAPFRSYYFHRNYNYHAQIINACRPFMNPDSRVLELGSGTGDLLNALNPAVGVGVDISARSVEVAQANYPRYAWVCADAEDLPTAAPLDAPFDIIIISDLLGYINDIQVLFENIRRLTHPKTRLIISHWNWMWEQPLKLAEMLRLKTARLHQHYNWLSPSALNVLLTLADYDVLDYHYGLLLPLDVPIVGDFVNSLANTPILGRFALSRMVIARPAERAERPTGDAAPSVTVVIPTRNERGNIEAAVLETPEMGSHTELLFIDGNSTDGTVEEIHRQMELHPERDIKYMPQVTTDTGEAPDLMLKLGKGDAVRKAFEAASGDIVMILDSDLTVPPHELSKFYDALVSGKGRFINGSRLVYPQETAAMRPLNRLGNIFFSYLFTWLLDQPITDTLCGTKVLYKADYQRIADNRSYFGDFDPFGDFDLLFGAAHLPIPIIDLPVHYRARTYGDSKVRVDLHGPLLGRMSLIAFLRLKLQPMLDPNARRKPRDNSADKRSRLNADRWLMAALLGVLALMWWLMGRED